MGTRCLIKVQNLDGKEIVTIYTQHDGYPDGWMLEVARFLSMRKMVNGIQYYDVINGMEDLASQIITLLKLRCAGISKEALGERYDGYFMNRDYDDPVYKMIVAGGVYVHPAGDMDLDEEWVYYIKPDEEYAKSFYNIFGEVKGGVIIEVYKPRNGFASSSGLELVWKGTPEEYVKEFTP